MYTGTYKLEYVNQCETYGTYYMLLNILIKVYCT